MRFCLFLPLVTVIVHYGCLLFGAFSRINIVLCRYGIRSLNLNLNHSSNFADGTPRKYHVILDGVRGSVAYLPQ